MTKLQSHFVGTDTHSSLDLGASLRVMTADLRQGLAGSVANDFATVKAQAKSPRAIAWVSRVEADHRPACPRSLVQKMSSTDKI